MNSLSFPNPTPEPLEHTPAPSIPFPYSRQSRPAKTQRTLSGQNLNLRY